VAARLPLPRRATTCRSVLAQGANGSSAGVRDPAKRAAFREVISHLKRGLVAIVNLPNCVAGGLGRE
jgi:hypothetical protein